MKIPGVAMRQLPGLTFTSHDNNVISQGYSKKEKYRTIVMIYLTSITTISSQDDKTESRSETTRELLDHLAIMVNHLFLTHFSNHRVLRCPLFYLIKCQVETC